MKEVKMAGNDVDFLEILKYMYFGDISDIFKAASARAYRDFCRTLEFADPDKKDGSKTKIDTKLRDGMKENTTNYLVDKILNLPSEEIKDQTKFDDWHEDVCNNLISNFSCKGKEFLTVGQAQKWLNMTLKYLYILGYNFGDLIQYFHVPIDNVVIEMVKIDFSMKETDKSWSKWNYNTYIDLQKRIRDNEGEPFLWELKNWHKYAFRKKN